MNLKLTAEDGHEFDCWIENASGIPRGGLVILQEIFGVTDQLKGLAARYGALGYNVAIPALFDRQKPGAVIPFDDALPGRDMMLAADLDQTMLDIAATVDMLVANGSGKIAAMGFCWGGGLAIRAAQKLDISAAVSFYGTRLPQYLDSPLKAPVLGHFGIHDDHVPAEMLDKAVHYLKSLKVYRYDTGHAFANDARPSLYNADAAELAHQRTQEFLAAQLS